MMKKLFVLVAVMAVMAVVAVAPVWAETKLLPEGTKISAINNGNGTATVVIAGVKPIEVEFYGYEGVKSIGAVTTFTIKLREGRRFNFTWGEGQYALITPQMKENIVDFVGLGVGVDCSDHRGCCFLITVK